MKRPQLRFGIQFEDESKCLKDQGEMHEVESWISVEIYVGVECLDTNKQRPSTK